MTRDSAKVASLLFFSGLSALVYQTVWLREFRLIFGGSTFATGAVLAIFMAGLGIGGAILGKRADTKERPLTYYARLELFIAAAAALSPPLLALAAKVYFASGGSPQLGLAGATLVRLALATIVLGPATVLMGGTLPAAARAVETNDDGGRRVVALLYGVNTLGAVAGTLLSTFVLLERYGNQLTLLSAVVVNLGVALVARRMQTSAPTPSPAAGAGEPGMAEHPPLARSFTYAAAAIAGFAFLLMELVWYRMLSPILGGTTYMFGLVLAIALAGIGLGGALYAVFRRGPATVGGFAITCSLEALAIAIPFALGDRIALLANALRGLGTLGFDGHVAGWTIITGLVVFPAAVIAGIQFPLLIALLGRGREDLGRQIGVVYAWNTLGAIAGSLAGGFGLMPLLTAPGTWRLVAILLALLGLAAGARAWRERQHAGSIVTASTAVAALLCTAAVGPTAIWRHSGIGVNRGPKVESRNELRRWINDRRRTMIWERDGRESSVAIVNASDISFIVNGKSDGSARRDASTQLMVGMIPAILHSNATSALVIGLGTGTTSGWLGAIPAMNRVDTIELEPVVLHVARVCSAVNAGAMTNPKVHVTIGDAREVLLTTDRRYDVIASEPSNPYRAGVASLFTREYYLAARGRLRPRGLFAQWLQSYSVHPETIRTIYATLTSVFPHVQTWWTAAGDLLLVASVEPIAIDADALRARLQTEPYRSALLNTWRIESPEGFLAHLIADENFSVAAAQQSEDINTDDRTLIEFGFARSVDAGERLNGRIVEDATRLHATRPRWIRGAVDWAAVERKRPWRQASGPPTEHGELMAVALTAAQAGDPRAEAWAPVVARTQPVEGELILATLRVRQKRFDEAMTHLGRMFVRYRKDPWAESTLMASAFELVREVALTSPQRARALFGMLSVPFATSQHESARGFSRIVIAPLFDKCGSQTIKALQAMEPYPIWDHHVLTIRANCYTLAGLETAPDAWDDLQAYDDAEQSAVVRPEDLRPQRGPSSNPR